MDSNLLWLSDMLDNPELFELPPVVAANVLWEKRLTLLAGREKLGKSTLATAIAARISNGEDFLSEPTPRGKVLWVSYEEPPTDIGRRFLHFGGRPENLAILSYPKDIFKEVMEACEEHQFEAIIWDSLATIADAVSASIPDPGNSGIWIRILSPILQITHEYAAGLLIHHARKSDGKFRDSTAIGSVPDAIIEMMRRKDPDRLLKCTGRYSIDETTISLNGTHYELVFKGTLEKTILDYVRKNPDCTWAELKEGVRGKEDAIRDARDRILESKELINVSTDRAHIYRVSDA